MNTFLSITFSFPTVIFTVLLAVAVIYWLISLLGLGDVDTEGDVDTSADLGGLMVTLGLQGVPLPLVLTLLFLGGWLVSYFAELWLGGLFGAGLLHIVFGIVVIPLALAAGLLSTAAMVRPLRPLFRRAYHRPLQQRVIGTPCVIVSSTVDTTTGRAEAHLNGAHLILQVRSDRPLSRRDRAVLVEHLPDQNAYWVIPEADFHSGTSAG